MYVRVCVCVWCVCGVCGCGHVWVWCMCVCGVCVCVVYGCVCVCVVYGCVCVRVKRQLVDVTREELVHNSSTGIFPSFLVLSLPKQHTECSTASLWVVIFNLHGYFYSGKMAVTVLIRRYCILIMMGTLLMGTYVSLPSLL